MPARHEAATIAGSRLALTLLTTLTFGAHGKRNTSPTALSPILKLAAFCKPRPLPALPCFWNTASAANELRELIKTSKNEVLAVRDGASHSALNMAAWYLNVEGEAAGRYKWRLTDSPLCQAGASAFTPCGHVAARQDAERRAVCRRTGAACRWS